MREWDSSPKMNGAGSHTLWVWLSCPSHQWFLKLEEMMHLYFNYKLVNFAKFYILYISQILVNMTRLAPFSKSATGDRV